jgi:hypothetical protein
MKKIFLIFLIFLPNNGMQLKAQSDIIFFGDLVSNKDTVLYFFDNNKEKINIVYCDEFGKYTLSIKSEKAKTITFYFKGADYCSQTLNLDKIRKQTHILENNKVQNDLSLIKGFACVRPDDCGVSQEVLRKFIGKWIDIKKLTLEFDCYYKREFVENGLMFLEDGNWSGNLNQIELESVYIKNTEIGTYLKVKRKLILNYKNGQLIPVDKELGYVKKN